jgi:hypothetical protein
MYLVVYPVYITPTGKQPGLLHPIPKFDVPMHTLHIDHLGPFVLSSRRNDYLVVAIDGFTKFAFLKAVRNTKVGPVRKCLDDIFNLFGVARQIVCDRGSSFTSKCFNGYCERINMKVNYNATATPRANGQAERYNRTILNALSTWTDNERKWDENVQGIQWGLNTSVNKTTGIRLPMNYCWVTNLAKLITNTSVNKTTGKTPYELLLGYQPRQANN